MSKVILSDRTPMDPTKEYRFADGKIYRYETAAQSGSCHSGWTCDPHPSLAHYGTVSWVHDSMYPVTEVGTEAPVILDPPGNAVELTASGFVVKDSGVREEYANGFVRDTEEGKSDLVTALAVLYSNPSLVDVITRPGFDLLPKTALIRWADHMEKGAQKYGRNNWTQARGPIAKARFLRSLARHVAQYVMGDRTEDHAAAVCFNVWAAEMTPDQETETQ